MGGKDSGDCEMMFVFLFLVISYLVEVNIIIHYGAKVSMYSQTNCTFCDLKNILHLASKKVQNIVTSNAEKRCIFNFFIFIKSKRPFKFKQFKFYQLLELAQIQGSVHRFWPFESF